jgi:hypothetical protein
MVCPLCKKKPMIILEHDGVEIDYCISCEGVWLDSGELRLLFDDETEYRRLMATGSPVEKAGEKKRRCPICRKKMPKIEVGTDEKVMYDQCVREHGIWLDKGELDEVFRIGHHHPVGSLIHAFLGGVFHGEKRTKD